MEMVVQQPGKVPIVVVPLMYRDVVRERPPTFVYSEVKRLFESHRAQMDAFVGATFPVCTEAPYKAIPKNETVPGEPYHENGWFTGGDAASAYSITATLKPARIIEIGSGNSTKFLRKAIRDYALTTHLTSIDPAPRAEVDALCDVVIRKSVLEAPLDLFDSLEAGDILFHDGSHITFNGTDTVRLFLEILPRLKAGVLVHIHDIFLPQEYPPAFDGRGYSEQYMLATTLLGSKRYEIVLPVAYLSSQGRYLPGCSFWMRVKG